MLRRSKGRKRITFRKTKARRRVSAKPRQRAFNFNQLKNDIKSAASTAKEKASEYIETNAPEGVSLYGKLKERYVV